MVLIINGFEMVVNSFVEKCFLYFAYKKVLPHQGEDG